MLEIGSGILARSSGVRGPVERPPCRRHLRFPFIGNLEHGCPLLVFAPQMGLALLTSFIGLCSSDIFWIVSGDIMIQRFHLLYELIVYLVLALTSEDFLGDRLFQRSAGRSWIDSSYN